MKKISADSSDKTSPVQHLESIIAIRRKSQAEMTELERLLADKSARRLALETSGDLNDAAVITEIGHLRVFVEVLPKRIAIKEKEDGKAEETLTEATNEFIREHLGPRVQRLAARTRTVVENELSPHFAEPSALMALIEWGEKRV